MADDRGGASALPALAQRVISESEYRSLTAKAAELDAQRALATDDLDPTAVAGGGEHNLLETLLVVLDDLERALAAAVLGQEAPVIVAGVELVRSSLLATLARFGVLPIEVAPGDAIDLARHDVLNLDDILGPGGSGAPELDGELVVSSERRRGYTRDGRVVRRALVESELVASPG